VYGSKAVGEPPLMLAFSVREALRQAAAAFGVPGTSVNLASPATPEAVFWAVQAARDQAAGDMRGDVIEGLPGRVPPALDADAEPMHPSSERLSHVVAHA
jgi:xanthine dehydrogenase large subunit